MTIALVGSATFDAPITGSSHVFAYSSTGGNWLTFCCYAFGTGASPTPVLASITDTAGNTWNFSTSNAASPPTEMYADPFNSDDEGGLVAWAAAAAAVTSVTVNFNATNYTGSMIIAALAEWSGVSSFDSGNTSQGAVSGGAYRTGALTTSTGTDLVIIANGGSGFSNGVPSGWNQFLLASNQIGYLTPGTVPAGSHQVTFTGVAGDFATAAIALAPTLPPVVHHAGVTDLGEENRKSWVKKRLLIGI